MYPLCRHIKTNGMQCQSPAMRQQPFCYYHGNFRNRDRVTGQSSNPNCMTRVREDNGTITLEPFADPGHNTLELGLLEDAESIQVAISTVVSALARNTLDTRRAARLLYGLRLAANNAQRLPRRKVKNRNDLVTATETLHGETVAPPESHESNRAFDPDDASGTVDGTGTNDGIDRDDATDTEIGGAIDIADAVDMNDATDIADPIDSAITLHAGDALPAIAPEDIPQPRDTNHMDDAFDTRQLHNANSPTPTTRGFSA